MAFSLRDQLTTPDIDDTMPFLDRLGLMVEHEEVVRGDRRLARRLYTAKLHLQAAWQIWTTARRGAWTNA